MGILEIVIVLIEGLLSFFSPCIIPVLPIYIGLLSTSETESKTFLRSGLVKNTVAFVLGISTAFFLLGVSIQALSVFVTGFQSVISFVGGLFIIGMGLFYLDVIKLPFLNRESKMNFEVKQMNGLTAYLLGFTFSFGWTPCVGPMLASVLMMSMGQSLALVFVYTLGFVIPFLIVALFYTRLRSVLAWVKGNGNKIKVVGGVILILSGAYMVANHLEVFDQFGKEQVTPPTEQTEDEILAVDFKLKDQAGNVHQLSDYKGKLVFLTFWTTWCPNCSAELPHLNKLYQEYGKNFEDVIILTIASPNVGREGDEAHIKAFIEENNYTLPVLMDEGARIASSYGVQAVPTSFIITKEGTILGYIPGRVGEENLREIFESLK